LHAYVCAEIHLGRATVFAWLCVPGLFSLLNRANEIVHGILMLMRTFLFFRWQRRRAQPEPVENRRHRRSHCRSPCTPVRLPHRLVLLCGLGSCLENSFQDRDSNMRSRNDSSCTNSQNSMRGSLFLSPTFSVSFYLLFTSSFLN
jgi:hypothetical protein